MKISTLIAASLTVLATAQHVCKSPAQTKDQFDAILGEHDSIYAMIHDSLNDENERGMYGSVVFPQWGNRQVAVKFQKVATQNGLLQDRNQLRRYDLALSEATYLNTVSQNDLPNHGNVKPEFIACEKGDFMDGNQHYLYVIIVMDKLDHNFKSDANNGLMDDLKLDIANPVRRLKIYLRMARSLQAMHHSGLVHLDIKPANVVAKRDLSAIKWIDYGTVEPANSFTKCGGTLTFFDKRKTKIHTMNKQLWFKGRQIDKNMKAVDIWAFGITIYQIECKIANRQDRARLAQGNNINVKFENIIAEIIANVANQDHCFQPSMIHQLDDNQNRSFLDLLTQILALNRSQRTITAGQIADRMLLIIQKNNPDFLETDNIGPIDPPLPDIDNE